MRNGWYILNYHDISWEENAYERAIGGNLPPDVFRSQLASLTEHAKLVSITDGIERFRAGVIEEPLVSLWFDDGLAGVRRYALPLMEQFGVKGAMSVCSKFMLHQEFFWRFKLAYLSQGDGLRFLRSRLRKLGYRTEMSVRAFTLDHFSEDVLAAIDDVFGQFTREIDRRDAFRLFDDVAGIAVLRDAGWEIANHTASHYPVSEGTYIHRFRAEYETCEATVNELLGVATRFWVMPFDRSGHRSPRLYDVFQETDDHDRTMVLVGHQVNVSQQRQGNVLFRIYPPYTAGPGLIRFLNTIPLATASRPLTTDL